MRGCLAGSICIFKLQEEPKKESTKLHPPSHGGGEEVVVAVATKVEEKVYCRDCIIFDLDVIANSN